MAEAGQTVNRESFESVLEYTEALSVLTQLSSFSQQEPCESQRTLWVVLCRPATTRFDLRTMRGTMQEPLLTRRQHFEFITDIDVISGVVGSLRSEGLAGGTGSRQGCPAMRWQDQRGGPLILGRTVECFEL